ncbi:MAG: amino acid-binding protein [Alphaproteobacteria bacterium]|nr:amino acid-binding protein [Alphaproteobacteria bacterium]
MTGMVLIKARGRDRVGLIAALTGRLFELGLNLGDTAFAVLGTGFEFSTVADVAAGVDPTTISRELVALPELRACAIEVHPFTFEPVHAESGRATHRIRVAGGDQPGLIARLAEAFGQFGANIVRLNSEREPGGAGFRYSTQFEVAMPADRAEACIAAVANTAEQLHLDCSWVRL